MFIDLVEGYRHRYTHMYSLHTHIHVKRQSVGATTTLYHVGTGNQPQAVRFNLPCLHSVDGLPA